MSESAKMVLVGNPNSGKTALFNALTGMHQRVGNWPGVTVDKKEGRLCYRGRCCDVVDLPGIYSLSSPSEIAGLDEKIAREFLLNESIDVLVNVIDATNLERNLYLTTQLLDFGIPVVLAVNMLDLLTKRDKQIDLQALSQEMGCPVVGVVANRKQNVDELKKVIVAQIDKPEVSRERLRVPSVVRRGHADLVSLFSLSEARVPRVDFISMALLEDDDKAIEQVPESLVDQIQAIIHRVRLGLDDETDLIIADRRYRWSRQVCSTVLSSNKQGDDASLSTWSSRLDAVLLNRFLGFPIFFLVMYALFFFAINFGGAFQDFFDQSSDAIFVQGLGHWLNQCHAPGWLVAILADGIGKGINTTVTFIPMIAALFFFLSFLEDSGYMARATFLMDRLMRYQGLPGEAFVPMIVGFGCNVPAVMGARTLSKPRDRVLTVMMMPFMACSARFAIFTIFAAAFFAHKSALLIFALYLIGIVAAIGTGLVLRKTCLGGKTAPLVMELPMYHRPQFKVLWRLMWRRARAFVLRAGKVIIPVSVVLGGLNAITLHGDWQHANQRDSVLSAAGKVITPVFSPMGITQDNWPATVGLATGVMAKEVVIGTLNSLYAQESTQYESFDLSGSLIAALKTVPQNLVALGHSLANPIAASAADVSMDPEVMHTMQMKFGSTAAAFSYLLFVLLYFPCISTLAVMRREVGKRWATLSIVWSFGVAYAAGVMNYQIMTWRQHAFSSTLYLSAVVITLMVSLMAWKMYASKSVLMGDCDVIGA